MKSYKKTHIRQQDQSDCGVACLLSVMQYYGWSISLEALREWSGTNKQGTTLLGLYQCAEKLGFEAKAFKATPKDLQALKNPCILHVQLENNLQHYIVFYFMNIKMAFLPWATPQKELLVIRRKNSAKFGRHRHF